MYKALPTVLLNIQMQWLPHPWPLSPQRGGLCPLEISSPNKSGYQVRWQRLFLWQDFLRHTLCLCTSRMTRRECGSMVFCAYLVTLQKIVCRHISSSTPHDSRCQVGFGRIVKCWKYLINIGINNSQWPKNMRVVYNKRGGHGKKRKQRETAFNRHLHILCR